MRYSMVINQPVPQTELLNNRQIKNNAGGYSYAASAWDRLSRFLLIGTEGGTYYVAERKLTVDAAQAVLRCIAKDGVRVVNEIVAIDTAGRAPKKTPAHFALALCLKHGDDATRKAACEALPQVCRTASHLFELIAECDGIGKGWSRGYRRAVAKWYESKATQDLVYQAVKYGTRNGYSHRDVLRLAHPKFNDAQVGAWLAGKGEPPTPLGIAVEQLKAATEADEAAALIQAYKIPREAVPTGLLNEGAVWAALLPSMPMTAMVRNLGKMTSVGLLSKDASARAYVVQQLTDLDAIRKARLHPLNLLIAMKVYASGKGVKGSLSWVHESKIVAALGEAITLSFGALPQRDIPELVAVDISGSMDSGMYGGGAVLPGGTRLWEAAACMAMASVQCNPNTTVVAFGTGFHPMDIHGRRMDDIVKSFGGFREGTDLTQPIAAAMACVGEKPKLITIYTDNETWAGRSHVEQVWATYKKMVPDAKLVVASMTATGVQTMPNSPDLLQVVGFDTAIPEVIHAFAS
jgi:60 kDa SS-A/Ro ribonucleoprotein